MATMIPESPIALTVSPNTVIDEIHVYNRDDYNGWFENEYSSNEEPWTYSHRGAELYRHLYTLQQIKKYNAHPQVLLELGSSKGLMTVQLTDFCDRVVASDISLTAMKACKKQVEARQKNTACEVSYFVATTPGLPFANDSFDVVTICDGLEGWWFSPDKKKAALEDVHRVLKKGGIAVLTDFFIADGNREKFTTHEKIIRNSPLTIVHLSHLYDRPWYLLESFAKKTRLQKSLRWLLASVPVAKALNGMGKLFGKKVSNHIVVIARKD